MAPKVKVVTPGEAHRFMHDCFLAVKLKEENADRMADMLLFADKLGHPSQGMNHLEWYLNCLHNEIIDHNAKPKIAKQSDVTAWVEGNNALGILIGIFSMKLAIKKARKNGIGFVVASGSNHYGHAAYYARMAMAQSLIGITMTNNWPLLVPTHGKESLAGLNTLAFGTTASMEENFLLNMSTSIVSMGRLEIYKRKSQSIPKGVALDKDWKYTTDPDKAVAAGHLMPLGGEALTAGYKGYGLSCMIDILCGVLSGANYLDKLAKWSRSSHRFPANLGHVFIAIDPIFFNSGFTLRLEDFNSRLRKCTPTNPAKPVLVPGDKEEQFKQQTEKSGVIMYTLNQLKTCDALAARLKVTPIVAHEAGFQGENPENSAAQKSEKPANSVKFARTSDSSDQQK